METGRWVVYDPCETYWNIEEVFNIITHKIPHHQLTQSETHQLMHLLRNTPAHATQIHNWCQHGEPAKTPPPAGTHEEPHSHNGQTRNTYTRTIYIHTYKAWEGIIIS